MKDRIQRILDYYQITASEFAKIIGVNASGISHILGGNRTHLSTDTIIKLSQKFPEINLDWLILGKGEMISNSRQARLFDQLDADDLPVTEDKSNVQISGNKLISEITSPQLSVERVLSQERKVIRIVTFYSDNTYQDFFP